MDKDGLSQHETTKKKRQLLRGPSVECGLASGEISFTHACPRPDHLMIIQNLALGGSWTNVESSPQLLMFNGPPRRESKKFYGPPQC